MMAKAGCPRAPEKYKGSQKKRKMDAFERARKVALRVMRMPMWQKGIGEEDPLMVAHIPQLARINKLGMITINSQAGNVRYLKSLRAGKRGTMAERKCTLATTKSY